jgi:hypothetical protein
MTCAHYEITVEGHLACGHWSRWFGGMRITLNPDGSSTLAGPVADQAALHGLLASVRDLGLTLVRVQRVEAGDRGSA